MKNQHKFSQYNIPKEGSQFICLSVISIDYVFRTGINYYVLVFLEECKYIVKEKQSPKDIDDIEISSDSDREHFDAENSSEGNFDEKIPMKKIKRY